jgi:predicted MFS family arabinose efflux permease
MLATGIGFAGLEGFWPLLLVALVGTLSPTGGDSALFQALEHTVLAQSVPPAGRTAAFARYSFAGAVVGAFGALAAGAVDWLSGLASAQALTQALFLLYGLLGLASLTLYRGLSPAAEAPGAAPPGPLGPSRRRVLGLAALFALDSFGGGFVVNALLALWLAQRFGLDAGQVGIFFFVTGLCTAVSFFAAVRIARRIGLLNTMVFTHLPANVALALVAFAPDAATAFALLVIRALLSQMDVPARASYVMAVVEPHERPAAASLTAVPRGLAASLSPMLSGWMLGLSSFGWPLLVGGALKVLYDLLLLRYYAAHRPPEEE